MRIVPMPNQRGGKRAGAGRPKGSTAICAELRESAQKHTQDALAVLVEIMQDKSYPQRLKAAELILTRGHGSPREVSPALDIIDQFVNGEISAITACLMLEAEGLKVPDVMRKYFYAEIQEATRTPFHLSLDDNAKPPLPRS
jgi:hypothetical protein